MSEENMPEDWVGEQVRFRTEAGEEVRGTLEGTTEHGFVVNTTGRRTEGPSYYSWKSVTWMYPVDRQTTKND